MANISNTTNDTTTDIESALNLGKDAKVIMYSILIVLSLIANVLVIAVVCGNKNLRTVFNAFIVNMAISDLFIPLISLPIKVVEFAADKQALWLIHGGFGNVTCRIFMFLMDISPGVSVLSLVIIAVNRFVAIVKPMSHAELFSIRRCKILIAMTWVLVLIFFAPYFFINYTEMVDGYNRCNPNWVEAFGSQDFRTAFLYSMAIVFFVVPFSSIIVLYSIIIYKLHADSKTVVQMLDSEEARKRKARNKHIFFLSLAMIIAFAVFWGPFFLLLLITLITEKWPHRDTAFIVQFIGYSNSIVNPLIYFIFMGKFRSGLKRLFCKCLENEPNGSPNASNTRSLLLTKYTVNEEKIKLKVMGNTNTSQQDCLITPKENSTNSKETA